ncbi:tyrosine-type recombinase/integrase [Methylobacterium sp. Leaf87]|uniref:tyrosine-type recombinase/integrase n=1 Tax=Methylobacterium sp. Leaf87 TaxID=1736243 RepID=UPI0007003696|nr:tyrosine-type recombinase/integrase [Methylobacterium sp. Leaf87]
MQRAAFARAEDDVRVVLMTAAAAIPEPDNKRGPPSEGPHLVLRRSRTDPTKFTWYIRDGKREESTRQPLAQRKKADRALDLYKLQTEARERGIVAPRMVPIAATINYLLDAARPPGKPPVPRKTSLRSAAAKETARLWKVYRKMARRLASLATFFKDETLKDLSTTRCIDYIEWRSSQRDARYLDDDPDAPNASPSTAREDIRFLRKAVKLYAGEHALAWHPNVEVPAPGPGRTRWLRRSEVARMYWAIRGRIWDNETGAWKRERVMGPRGRMVTRYAYRDPQTIANRKPLRRYLFVGLYTGTRDEALRELSWECTADGGCIDVEGRFIHRRGFGADPSKGKPRMTSRIAPKIASTLGVWRKSDLAAGIAAVVSRPDGEPYASTPVWIWEAVVADAGLDEEVVRHTLRHTAATWLRIARVDVRAAADLLGMSVQTAVKIYGQWTLEGQDAAADALAWSHGVKAAHSFAIKVPSTIEVVVPRGLPPREHPSQTERRRRERIRATDHATRRRIDPQAALSRLAPVLA